MMVCRLGSTNLGSHVSRAERLPSRFRGCIHLRSGFITPGEPGVYQRAGIGYVPTPEVGRPSFLDDVQALTTAAPADAACLNILQLDA